MADFLKKTNEGWQDVVCLLAGIWLMLSPWILGFAGMQLALWNALLFGAVIAVMAILAIVQFHDWEEWADMAVGAWLVISPWVLGFAALTAGAEGGAFAATWNFVVIGLLTLALAAWSLRSHHDARPA
ncbi:hypothetical protein GE300_00060 [Rhodobacteraceae bacterium 2CG4]|uniref:SPW repeat-containing integral membrane domain-containing protein n=1 Tax=Halovulum marinum TaxID=2662447 RepID=A0A6L5YUQ2_9RHOB|nr:SPW repeat protein [Halovulum marinum]MSU88008.1 hypothetical protein [Halovulum marinum]